MQFYLSERTGQMPSKTCKNTDEKDGHYFMNATLFWSPQGSQASICF